jgi:hypothetical protein
MAKLSRKVPLKVTFYIAVLQPPYSRNYKDLGCSPFARHYSGNHYCFLFLRVHRCFSSPGSLPFRDFRPSAGRVSPFGNLRIERIFAPPRSLSQLITSFIASESQGIHHTLLITFFVTLQLNIQFFPACQRT